MVGEKSTLGTETVKRRLAINRTVPNFANDNWNTWQAALVAKFDVVFEVAYECVERGQSDVRTKTERNNRRIPLRDTEPFTIRVGHPAPKRVSREAARDSAFGKLFALNALEHDFSEGGNIFRATCIDSAHKV
jgi:hypothetical protein